MAAKHAISCLILLTILGFASGHLAGQEEADRKAEDFDETTGFEGRVADKTSQLLEQVLKKVGALEKDNEELRKELTEQREIITMLKASCLKEKQKDDPYRIKSEAESTFAASSPVSTNPSTQAVQDFKTKRSDDAGTLEPVINQMNQQMTHLTAQIEALEAKEKAADARFGTAYVRWGHASCPSSAELMYSGIAGGAHYNVPGGGANYLCLQSSPSFDSHPLPTVNGVTEIYGSEYEICEDDECNTTPACAVCHINRSAAVMVPGTNACPSGWTQEYSGYIMANNHAYPGASQYICVDSHKENVQNGQHNDNQNLMYYAVFKCGALPCPPYAEHKLATCVVCSK